MNDAISITLAAAYALQGVAAVITPASGTGPVACRMILGPTDEVVNLLQTGNRAAGYQGRVLHDEVPFRPVEGDIVTVECESLTLRITLARTSPLDREWYFSATPILAPTLAPSSGVGHLMPPLLGGWAWA